jgi:OmpA-OmpF porin, OOP family
MPSLRTQRQDAWPVNPVPGCLTFANQINYRGKPLLYNNEKEIRMRRVIAGLVATFVLGVASLSAAGDCSWPYVGIIGGASTGSDTRLSLATGYSVGGVAGFEFCNARVEAEVSYRNSSVDNLGGAAATGSIDMLSYMVNGYYEFNVNNRKWRPYVGGGGGLARAELSSDFAVGGVPVSGGSTDTRFAYQGIAGVGYYLTKHIVLDASYRFFSTLRFKLGGVDASYATHNAFVGARLRF